ADGGAAVTDAADAAPKPVDPAELLCRASPEATPHRVAGSDCPSSGCTSCDDATDCEPGSVCVHSLTKGPEYIECLPRDAPYGTHAYTYDAWQACVQDCECLPRYGDHCVSGRCAAR
ncbi:MAG TPA: hypothetical protein VLT33_25040, partial [Labilithrix sp.]|nr:hypothetical protein [Labilithrix sp.]